MASGIDRRCATALVVALLSCAAPAHAGLSLDQAIARHRTLRDNAEGRDHAFALLAPPRDGVAPAVGGPSVDVPYLMAPKLRGRGGARVVETAALRGRSSLRLGVSWYEDAPPESMLEGSSWSWRLGGGEAYASVESRHWGPGWVGSLILDGAAPPMPAVGWRKTSTAAFDTRWLAWLGPWNADFFVGGLAGHSEPARPYLIGMRVQVRPLPGLEIGASRTMQWGGAGRDQSFGSLAAALVGRDNVDGDNRQSEPGNQLAGLDVRFSAPAGDAEWALYGQAVGEDEAGLMPSKLIVQAGAEWAMRWRGASLRFFAEGSDLIAGDAFGRSNPGTTYRHHIYRQGYTNRGLPLGHAAGGDVKLASLGALIDGGRMSFLMAAHRGRASDHAQRFAPGAALAGLNAAVSLDIERASRVGLSLWRWRAGDERSLALQAWWHTAWR